MHLWDRLLDQAQLKLNMLRPSRRNPKISVHETMEERFDFNKTPLEPPVTNVIVHDKTNRRRTRGQHVVQGRHIGPAVEHYR